jgi:hypothetical protein
LPLAEEIELGKQKIVNASFNPNCKPQQSPWLRQDSSIVLFWFYIIAHNAERRPSRAARTAAYLNRIKRDGDLAQRVSLFAASNVGVFKNVAFGSFSVETAEFTQQPASALLR